MCLELWDHKNQTTEKLCYPRSSQDRTEIQAEWHRHSCMLSLCLCLCLSLSLSLTHTEDWRHGWGEAAPTCLSSFGVPGKPFPPSGARLGSGRAGTEQLCFYLEFWDLIHHGFCFSFSSFTYDFILKKKKQQPRLYLIKKKRSRQTNPYKWRWSPLH